MVGVLVRANYGKRAWLRVDGVPVGEIDVAGAESVERGGRAPTPGSDRSSSPADRRCSPPMRAARPAAGLDRAPVARAVTRAATCSSPSRQAMPCRPTMTTARASGSTPSDPWATGRSTHSSTAPSRRPRRTSTPHRCRDDDRARRDHRARAAHDRLLRSRATVEADRPLRSGQPKSVQPAVTGAGFDRTPMRLRTRSTTRRSCEPGCSRAAREGQPRMADRSPIRQ